MKYFISRFKDSAIYLTPGPQLGLENATNRVTTEVRRAAIRRQARPGTTAAPADGGSGDIGSIYDRIVQQNNATRGGGENSSFNVIVMIIQYLSLPFTLWKSDPLELWRSKKRDSSFLPLIDVVKVLQEITYARRWSIFSLYPPIYILSYVRFHISFYYHNKIKHGDVMKRLIGKL